MDIKLKGKVLDIFNTNQVTEKFKKRLFVIEVGNGQYFNQYAVELQGDNCSLINESMKGEPVKIDAYIKSKHWKDEKYFTTIIAKTVTVLNGKVDDRSGELSEPKLLTAEPNDDKSDDLPF